LMNFTSLMSRAFGKRDWVEHAAIDVYNTLAKRRGRTVGKGELLVLIPRCLSKQALDGVLAIAGRYEVPVFVATRGQLARRVIRERRPRAVVAVACERDMMTGLRDVAGKLPVLGLTMRLPNGPCRDAMLDLETMERWVQSLGGAAAVPRAARLGVVPGGLGVAGAHVEPRHLQALRRHQIRELRRDALGAGVEDRGGGAGVGSKVGTGGDGGAGGEKEANGERG